MTIKSLDDIDREKRERARAEMKDNVTNDIDDVMKDLFSRFKGENEKRKKEKKKQQSIFIKLLKWLGLLGLGLLVLNLIIGNLWLLKFFIKDFFNL